jgi:hypothetical protein
VSSQAAIETFFSAMNARDADAAAAVVHPDVEITLGGHALNGQAAVRELALQEDPQLVFENVPVSVEAESDTRSSSRRGAHRTGARAASLPPRTTIRWRSTWTLTA